MASRGGPRAAGTDGTDFSNRETIKAQYYIRNGAAAVVNDDPGVVDEDDDVDENGFVHVTDSFRDKMDLLEEIRHNQRLEQELPLTGDYQGLGGPESIPYETFGPFEKPWSPPHKRCLLDELYLSPTRQQIEAFAKIERRKLNAQNKLRLKWSIGAHFLLFILMSVKLVPEVLDQLDVFILEIEELFIPKAHMWEWFWLSSVIFTFFGLSACRKSNASAMTYFVSGIAIFAIIPSLVGLFVHFNGVYALAETKSLKGLELWEGYPVSVLWYIFLGVAMQVHIFELVLAFTLMKVWRPKRRTD